MCRHTERNSAAPSAPEEQQRDDNGSNGSCKGDDSCDYRQNGLIENCAENQTDGEGEQKCEETESAARAKTADIPSLRQGNVAGKGREDARNDTGQGVKGGEKTACIFAK